MEVASSAAGIASLGIQVCQGLLSYYDGWRGYHEDVKSAYERVQDLSQTFVVLRQSLDTEATETEIKTSVIKCLKSSEDGLLRLQKRLQKLQRHREPEGIRQKTWTELQRAWYPFRASTLVKVQENVDELRDDLSLAFQVLQQSTLNKVQQTAQSTARDVSELLTIQQLEKYKKAVEWLSPPDPWYNHHAACSRREPGTGSWLLECDAFLKWKANDKAVLWLTGQAGSGKTFLCSNTIEEIRRHSEQDPNVQLAFFYFSFSDTQKQSYTAFLSSLVVQLSKRQGILDKLLQVYDRYHPSKPSREVLEGLLLTCLQQPGQTILIMDALDELPEDESGRQAVENWLTLTLQDKLQFKVFATSRQLGGIKQWMKSIEASCVFIQPDVTNTDIRQYVSSELEKHPKLRCLGVDLKEKIKAVFEEKADGMFRWAFCQLEELKKLKLTGRKHVERALNLLPPTLDETYDRMLLSIDETCRPEAVLALRWLTFATRPLTLAELSDACLIDYTTEGFFNAEDRGQLEDIFDLLVGLIAVDFEANETYGPFPTSVHSASADSESNKPSTEAPVEPSITGTSFVRLAHFSVKEYLVSPRIRQSKAAQFALESAQDRWILAQSSLAYVLHYSENPTKKLSQQDLDEFPFLDYAAESWTELLPECKTTELGLEVRLLESEEHRLHWLTINELDDPVQGPIEFDERNKAGDALYYSSLIGLVPFTRKLLEDGTDPNASRGYLGHVLTAATVGLHKEIVELLLDKGADVNATGGDDYTALIAASRRGQTGIVELILDRDADVNATGGIFGPALLAASIGGYGDIVELLLDNGADVNAKDGFSQTALLAASELGYRDIVELLLNKGADVNAESVVFGTSLQGASREGHKEIEELLRRHGARH